MYEDMPEECLMDDFHQMMFPAHSLGYNILGTKKSLAGIEKQELVDFHHAYYQPANMVVSIVGNLTLHKVEQLINKHLDTLSRGAETEAIRPPSGPKPFEHVVQKSFQQSYCMLGTLAYSRYDEKRYALSVLNALLGGTGMSSRLNMSVREKYGYVYQIDTGYIPYQDTGMFTIDFSTDAENLQRCLSLIIKELEQLQNEKLGKIQLNRAKRQVTGQAAMMQESEAAMMQSLGRQLQDHGEVMPLEHFFSKIENVSATDVRAVAREILREDRLSRLVYQPADSE